MGIRVFDIQDTSANDARNESQLQHRIRAITNGDQANPHTHCLHLNVRVASLPAKNVFSICELYRLV